MSIIDGLEYRRFYIKKLCVDNNTKIEIDYTEKANIEFGFGIASPVIIDEEKEHIAVIPFKIELNADEVSIESEFIIGFEIKDFSALSTESEIKKFINEHDIEFTEIVNNVINEIIDNALEHVNIRFGSPMDIDLIRYSNN